MRDCSMAPCAPLTRWRPASSKRIVIVTAYGEQGDKAPKREIDRAESIRSQRLDRPEEKCIVS